MKDKEPVFMGLTFTCMNRKHKFTMQWMNKPISVNCSVENKIG